MLKWLYKRYKHQFQEFMVEDFYGFIPKDLKEPSIEFLINGKDKLERFFSIQAYNMQRRSITDPKNAEKYQGMLIHIRSLLVILQGGQKPRLDIPEDPKKVEDPIDGVNSFIEKGKALIIKKNK